MTANYRTSFVISDARDGQGLSGIELLETVSDVLYASVRSKYPDVDKKAGLWRSTGTGKTERVLRLYGDSLEESGIGYYGLTLERSEAHEGLSRSEQSDSSDIWWALRIQMATQGEQISVTVEDECINGLQILDSMAWPPPVVTSMFDKFECHLGEEMITTGAVRIGNDEVENFVQGDLFNENRLLPVIALRDDIKTIDPDFIQSYFMGQARVVVYGEDVAWDINVLMGRSLACRSGEVRVYWPGCSPSDDATLHPRFTPPNVVERLGDRLHLVLRDEFVSYFSSPAAAVMFNRARGSFNNVSGDVHRAQISQRKDDNWENEDVARILNELATNEEELSKENARLREQNEQLAKDNAQLKAQNEQLLVVNEYEEVSSQPEPEVSTPPTDEYTVIRYKPRGRHSSLIDDWRNGIDGDSRQRIDEAIARMRQGNLGDVKNLRGSLYERKIDYGPGLRIYYKLDRDNQIILLGGGTKDSQDSDIERARQWIFLLSNSSKG